MAFTHAHRMAAILVSISTMIGSPATAADTAKSVEAVTLTDIRGMRYCEFLLIFEDRVDIYNTSASDGCPEEKWAAMDATSLAKAHDAKMAQLNGPKFWAMDEQTIGLGETKTFGGIDARYGATLPLSALGASQGSNPYTPFTSAKLQTMVFKADNPVFEVIDAEGNRYALNAYGAQVRDGNPSNLGDQLSPSEGWSFAVTTPAEDLTIEGSPDVPVHMVGDDMHQYYTRFGSTAE